LDELEGKAPSSPAIRAKDESTTDGSNAGRTNRRSKRRSSMSDGAESLSRSGSDSSVSNQRNSGGGTGASAKKKQENGSEPIRKVTCRILDSKKPSEENPSTSRSPESGICTSSMSLPSSSSGSNDNGGKSGQLAEDEEDDDEEFYDADPLPILGRCRALYSFEVTSEGSIRMDENEELWVIETDQGDGWTRVRRIKPSSIDPMPEGFVPTSYIETTELFAVPHPV